MVLSDSCTAVEDMGRDGGYTVSVQEASQFPLHGNATSENKPRFWSTVYNGRT